jgi:serine/threonine protein kinase
MSSTAEYWIGPLLGEGSFGRVFYARHKGSHRAVAIKAVEQCTCRRVPAMLDSIRNEQWILHQLRHVSNFVSLYASFVDAECVYLVMEWLPCDLEQLVKHTRKQAEWYSFGVAHYGLQIVSALEALHARCILHADLKPSNVLVTMDGCVKLADFGSAMDLSLRKNDFPHNHTTSRKRIRGTAQYSSPEVIRGSDNVSVAIDLWSLGCILYALLQGESPFVAESEALTVDKVIQYVHNQHHSILEDVDSAWQPVIASLLHPVSSLRLGVNDPVWASVSQPQQYDSIRSHMPAGPNATSLVPSSLTPNDKYEKLSTNDMVDGSHGWTVFLM